MISSLTKLQNKSFPSCFTSSSQVHSLPPLMVRHSGEAYIQCWGMVSRVLAVRLAALISRGGRLFSLSLLRNLLNGWPCIIVTPSPPESMTATVSVLFWDSMPLYYSIPCLYIVCRVQFKVFLPCPYFWSTLMIHPIVTEKRP